jgi:hypothetical protein
MGVTGEQGETETKRRQLTKWTEAENGHFRHLSRWTDGNRRVDWHLSRWTGDEIVTKRHLSNVSAGKRRVDGHLTHWTGGNLPMHSHLSPWPGPANSQRNELLFVALLGQCPNIA